MREPLKATLDGREVELREVKIGAALAANKAGNGDTLEVSMRVMVESAHYVDTGERVFADRAAIDDAPMRLMHEIGELNKLAGLINGRDDPHEAAKVPTNTNGTGEAHPSP